MRVQFISLSLLLVSSCSFIPDYERPELPLNDQFIEPVIAGESVANIPWWEFYSNSELKELITIAVKENKDSQIALARIQEAAAALGFARADMFPRIDLSGNGNRTEISDEVISGLGSPINDFGIFSNLSYELDFWGRVRGSTEAARHTLLASEYGYRNVTLTLVSLVARTYLQLLGLDHRLAITNGTLTNRSHATSLIGKRYEGGLVPELDLNQAQIEEADTRAGRSSLEREVRQTENILSILLGRPPAAIIRKNNLNSGIIRAEIPAEFPATLLKRRPDILAAEERILAELAGVGVARAEYLPRFTLLGFVGLHSNDNANLFDSNAFTWSIGGDLVGPLLNYGKTGSQVDVAKARAEQAKKSYESAVINAVRDVEDALVSVRTYADEHSARLAQLKAARNAAKLSRVRYDDGITSYLEVLDIERSLFQAELDESITQQRYLASIVQLYAALGGGWQVEQP